MKEYHGIIIKEGLRDPSILNRMRILGRKKAGEWTLLRVGVEEGDIHEIVKLVQRNLVTNQLITLISIEIMT